MYKQLLYIYTYTRGPTNHQKPGFPFQTNWFWYVKAFTFHGFDGPWYIYIYINYISLFGNKACNLT